MKNDEIEGFLRNFPVGNSVEQNIYVALYRRLAKGHPVQLRELSRDVDLSVQEIASILESVPGVFKNDKSEIIGFRGLALPKMGHELRVDDQTLFTLCAWDSLFIPEILGKEANIISKCPVTKEEIRLTVSPERAFSETHDKLRVSFVIPEKVDHSIIESFCHFVHFFANEKAFENWTVNHPDAQSLSLQEAFEIGKKKNALQFVKVLGGKNEKPRE